MSIGRSISESTHERTGPGPVASIFGARDLVIDGLYTLGVTDDLGGASIDDSAGTADDRLSVDRNTAERALPVTLQYLLLRLDRRHHRTVLSYLCGHRHVCKRARVVILVRSANVELRT
jgi:hypothetical protein